VQTRRRIRRRRRRRASARRTPWRCPSPRTSRAPIDLPPPSPGGVGTYSVTIANTCLHCTVRDVHISCGDRVRPGAARRRPRRLPPRGRRRLPRPGRRRRPGPRRVRLLPLLQLVPVPPPRRLGRLRLAAIASRSLGRGRRRRERARVHRYMHATVPGK